LALAFDTDLAAWGASGMDTALFALACAACAALAAAEKARAAAIALGALAWVRPEGPLLTGLRAIALGLAAPRDRKRAIEIALLAAAPIAILTIARLAYFHDLLPNTFYAKMRAVDGRDYTGLGYLWSCVSRRPLLVLAAIGACAVAGRRRQDLRC